MNMGNEMGNSSTSGFREGDDPFQDKSLLQVGGADDLKGQNHVVALGKEDSNGGDQNTDNMEAEGEKSPVEVVQMDDVKGQNQEVSAPEDVYGIQKETGLSSINLEGVAEESHNYRDEKEETKNMITEEVKEKSSHDAAADDKNDYEIQTKLVSNEPEEKASTYVDDQNQDQKGDDNSTNTETEENSLQEADNKDEIKAQSDIYPAPADENNTVIETGLVLSDPDGIGSSCAGTRKQDEKEEDNTLNDESMGKFSQEAVNTDVVERQDHLIPGVEDKTVSISFDPEGTADLKVDNPEQDENEEDNTYTTEPQENPLSKDACTNDIEEKYLTAAAVEGEDCDNYPKQDEKEEENIDSEAQQEKPLPKDAHEDDTEEKIITIAAAEGEGEGEEEINADLVSGDPIAHNDQILEGQEPGKFELYPPTESAKVEPSEAADEGRIINPASLPEILEDHEIKQESILEEIPSGKSHHFEEQNLVIKEDEGTRESISDAASDISHDSVPQEPAVVEPAQSEIAKISGEELLQVCNGLQINSDHMVKPYLDCTSQENGAVLYSSLSTEMVKSVFPDLSPEAEQEMDGLSMKEMATKELSSEEQSELKDEDEAGNNSENATGIMKNLMNGVGAKSNGEMPSEMNSVKIDSGELHVDVVLSDEAQDFKLEVSETRDKGIVVSDKAILVREVTKNGDSKHSEEESKADELPQTLLNGHENEEKRCLMFDTSSDSNSSKDCQIEETNIVENDHLTDASINYKNEEQRKNSEEEAPLVIDPADNLLSVQKLKEEEFEEKKIIQKMAEEKAEDLNPFGRYTARRESGEQCISHSYPTEQALRLLPENDQQETQTESKKLDNSNESMVELKQQSSGEISSFVSKNLTESEKPLLDLSESSKTTPVTMAETKPSAKQSTEQCVIANGNYFRQESVGRFSTESNPDNMTINSQIRKSPSFDLDLRIDARAEESDQTPLLYQDKTIQSFSNQADVDLAVSKPENAPNSSQHEAMAAEEKVVTLERSDSEKSKTPFLDFLKEEEEETAHMLVNPKKPENPPAAMKATAKVSVKEVTSALHKGKEKRKPRASLFGTCICCAAVIN